MSTFAGRVRCWSLVASLGLLVSACGGGGGSSNANSVALVDPAPAYVGATAKATVSTTNAESLAVGGFTGGTIGSIVGTPRSVPKGAAASAGKDASLPAQHLALVIKKSLRRMEMPQVAKQRAKRAAEDPASKSAARVETLSVPGDRGGSATFTIDLNDSNRTFSGSINYNAFTSQGMVLSGSAGVMGTFDPNINEFTRLTITFSELRVLASNAGNDQALTLIGSLSWGGDFSARSDTLSMNMVLVAPDRKTYWFKDYEIATTYSSNGYLTQTISGRYYDPNQGYLDFTTTNQLLAYYGRSWPSQGKIRFTGNAGTWVQLGFQPGKMLIEADCDGNGTPEWQKELPTNDEPAQNAEPVANAGPDQAVSEGATVTLDGSMSTDADGDLLTYAWNFQACPNNCPSLSNANSANPSFVAQDVGSYILRLITNDGQSASAVDTVSVTATPAAASEPGLLRQQWQYGVLGSGIGRAGLLTPDLDGDGTPEIVAGATSGYYENNFWFVLRRTSTGDYSQFWRSELYSSRISVMLLADLAGDAKEDVVLGLADGKVLVYAGATLQEVKTVTTAPSLSAMAVADIDGDGAKEIVTSDGSNIYVYSAGTGALKWSLANVGGSSIALGNVDGDPAKEIVATDYGGKGYVIDGVSKAISWEYINGFGARVALADLDGDGMQEIVGASSWSKITVFDADRSTPAWEIPTSHDIGSLLLADGDGDGVPEIIYGDGQWGKIHAIDARTRVEKWAVSNPEHSVSGTALADVDRDGKKELLWGSGGLLAVADTSTGVVEWKNAPMTGPLSAVAVGDVDDDGEDEVVMVSSADILYIFNARTHALEHTEQLEDRDWMGVRSVQIGDVDGDGKTEFVLTTADLYDGMIRVYNGSTRALKKESAGYDGNFFSALAIGDVDGDGKTEIVAGQGIEHSGATGVHLVVFDGATLQEKWRSVDLGDYWREVHDVKLADLDGDGHQDIVATTTNRLIVYDGVNHDLKLIREHTGRALEVDNVDADANLELLVGRYDGNIEVLDGKTLTIQGTVYSFGKDPIDGLQLADLDGDGTNEWLVTGGGVLRVLGEQGAVLKWRSRSLSAHLGRYNHIGVKDTDGDGRKDVYIGSDSALYHFE